MPGNKNPGHTTMLALIGEHLGEKVGGHDSVVPGLVGAVGLPWITAKVGALKQHGIDSTNALVREALLNPNLARILMQKMPANADVTPQMMRRVGAAIVAGKAAQDRGE